jgi:hypothetical protein
VIIQKVFVESLDKQNLINEIEEHLKRVRDPSSKLMQPVNIYTIYMNYFLASLKITVGDVESASEYAETTLQEIKQYYGHLEIDYSIDPMLITLHGRFEKLTRE